MASDRPDCIRCIHYFVTWQSDKPRGCRAYEFKSEELPSDVVFSSSGDACKLFERKNPRPGGSKLLR